MLIPDVIEPVVAWRVWTLARGEGQQRLGSIVHDCQWPPRENLVARCLNVTGADLHRHDAPAPGCQCGIYGTNEPETLARYLDYGSSLGCVRVVGLVLLWGDVIEHERGWRASHAYPKRLWLLTGRPYTGWPNERALSDLLEYRVPVETFDLGVDGESLAATSRRLGEILSRAS